MNFFAYNIFRAFSLALLIITFPFAASAQGQVDTSELDKEIKDLLGKYVYLIGSITVDAEPDPVRPFVQLFRNIRVKVNNDLVINPDPEMISVRDYGENLKKMYPDGITCTIDLDNIKYGNMPENDGSRLVIEVKVRRTIEGSSDGELFKRAQKVMFLIGFEIIDGEYRNFLIHGISPLSKHDHDLIISFSPSYSRIFNSGLSNDSRFEIPWETSWRSSINYQYMINKSWGLGSGFNLAVNRHSLKLDEIDPLKGHDPNLINIEWDGELTYIEIPLYGVYHQKLGSRMTIELTAGGFGAYRIFESIKNKAENRHSGDILNGVISDPFNYENISNYNLGVDIGLGIRYSLAKHIGFSIKASYSQGIISLEQDIEKNLPYGIYQGQYYPMFYKSGSANYSQDLTIQAGLTFRIYGDKYFD